MAVYPKLQSILTEDEIECIPENIKSKLDGHLDSVQKISDDLKDEIAEANALLERQQFQFEKEVFESFSELKESQETCQKLKNQIKELEENSGSVQKQWKDLQKEHDAASLECQSVKRENELLTQERKHLAEQLEKRRVEIDKLNEDLKNFVEQVTAANEEKCEALAKCEEVKMKESNLQHQMNRLEQEKNLLEQQIRDLNAELHEKNHEIHTLRREKSTSVLELQAQLENRIDELHLLQKQVIALKETNEEKDRRVEALADKIRSVNQNCRQTEEQFQLELNAQTKLVELYKKASEDNQNRVQELVRAFEEVQKLLHESSEARNEAEKNCEIIEQQYKNKMEEMEKDISRLKEELKKSSDPSHVLTPESVETMFPTAAATSKVMKSGMTLTQMYSEYIKSQEEIQKLRNENLRLTEQLKQIVTEIEENTPIINQKMQDYHKALETISCLRTQLASSLTDYEVLQSEHSDAKRIASHLERENNRLKSQITDLNRQVQFLLKEVQDARCGYKTNLESNEVTSTDEVTANKVITQHLVTFKDISELQTKNQQLLAVVRDLGEQMEEQEKKLTNEKIAELKKELDGALTQLEDLKKNRLKQTELIETVIRQRDMYRVLLANQGFSESLLGPGHSLGSKMSFSPGNSVEVEAKSALKQLQIEFDNYKKEKAQNLNMYNDQIEKLRGEVSDLRIQNAKLLSQCEYSDERINLFQSNVENYKKEIQSLREKNQKHTALITQHQQTINTLRQDLMIAQEKIAKANVSIENLRAEKEILKNAEARLLQERESMCREQQNQSRVLANLQAVQNNLERIESETKRNLQYQVEKLEKENSMLRVKVENANEEYRSAVKVWEKQTKDMQQKVDTTNEKNQKLHEDLVDAYSRFHAVNQELSTLKAINNAEADKATKKPAIVVKTLQPSPSAADVKNLKEQLQETQAKLKALQEKLDLTSKSAEHYRNMCHDLELQIKEQNEINKQLKESIDSSVESSNKVKKDLEQSLEEMEKTNRDLIEENMKLVQEKNAQVQALQVKVTELQKQIDANKDESETAIKTAAQARKDCQSQQLLMQETQEKYERELMFHAEAVKELTSIKEEHQQCAIKVEQLSFAVKEAEHALNKNKESWTKREEMLLKEQESLNQRITDLQAQNDNLHHQLDMMGTQMTAIQSKNWEGQSLISSDIDSKDTEHLLQIIRYVRKEKEILSTQFDATQSENLRLKLKMEHLNSELNDVKAELKDLQNATQATSASDAQHAELLRKVEMMNLLTESNSLLRLEKEKLMETKVELETKVEALEKQLEPLTEANKLFNNQVETLSTENIALKQEVKSWQSRTNQLLEQSHRIGPQEYKNLTRELEELKSQKSRLAEELHRKQTEISQLNANINSLKKEIEALKNEVKEKSAEIEKMTEDCTEHQKTIVQVKKIGRKYKTQYDELKVTYDALVAKSKASENADDQTVQEMMKKVEEGEKAVKDLQEEVGKHKENALRAQKDFETIKNQASVKEDRARKLLAQAKQKMSILSNQNDTITSERNNIAKERDEMQLQIIELKKTSGKGGLTVKEEENVRVITLKSQYDNKISALEKELKISKETIEKLEKQYEELCQKMSQQQKQAAKPTAVGGLVERAGVSSEPLTANIKPLATSAQTSGGLRHALHTVNPPARSTPTASIRPMAIGTVAASQPTQTRMAAVLPTTAATTATSTPAEEEPVIVMVPLTTVPQATVQPTPATATVAPTTVAVTVTPSSHTPVISEVIPSSASAVLEPQSESTSKQTEPVQSLHITAGPGVSTAVTALVSPRIEVPASSEPSQVEGPAPTTSVIVSPPATQVVTPTIKRQRDESLGASDSPDSHTAQKRVKMISEGSQTNQQVPAVAVPPSSNIAIVSAATATVVSKSDVNEPSTSEVIPSTCTEMKDTPSLIVLTSPQVSTSVSTSVVEVKEEVPSVSSEGKDAEIIEVDDKEAQGTEWADQQAAKVESEFEVMEEEPEVVDVDTIDEFDDDGGQMEGITFTPRSGDDEDMVDDSVDDIEEMSDRPSSVPVGVIDVLDSGSDHQMEADSSSLQAAPIEQVMAPPSFPITQESIGRTEVTSVSEVIAQSSAGQSPRTTLLPRIPSTQDRISSASRQHLPLFTIPGQAQGFEDGDDSIVPSTPTLFVPRRTDGFAEAVSSPHVPQGRFTFSSSDSSPTQQGLSQLASQGALGVDDTRMDLSQFDDGSSSRIVPSATVQSSLPASEVTKTDEQVAPTQSTIVPTIKVDLADDSAPNIDQRESSIEKAESSIAALPESEKDEFLSKSLEEKKGSTSQQPVIVVTSSEETEKISSLEKSSSSCELSEMSKPKLDESGDGDQQTQGTPAQTQPQRKPIVWQEDVATSSAVTTSVTSITSTSTTSIPPSGQFSPPAAQTSVSSSRPQRARRMRYRGRMYQQVSNWPAPGRRGRSASRRGRMF